MSGLRFALGAALCWLCVALVGCASGGDEDEGCRTQEECPGREICVASKCTVLSCSNDFDCPVGTLCLGGFCEPVGVDTNNSRVPQDNNSSSPNNSNSPNNNAPDAGNNNAPDLSDLEDADEDTVEPDLVDPDLVDPEDMNEDLSDGSDLEDADLADGDEPDMEEPSCQGDAECEASEFCQDSVCVPGCHRDEGCLLGLVCDLETHMCVSPGCTSDAQCPPEERCNVESGACEPRPVVCAGQECESGQWCDDFSATCMDTVPGDLCATASACGEGSACIPFTDDNGDAALACQDPRGDLPAGADCEDDAACAAGYCVLGQCYSPCADHADCGSDEVRCVAASVTAGDNGTPEDPEDDPSYELSSCVRVDLCGSSADCDETSVCTVRPVGDEILPVCVPLAGDVSGGGPCRTSEECTSGLCIGQVHRVCAEICQEDEDCSQANTTCQDTSFASGGDTPNDPSDDQVFSFSVCEWALDNGQNCASDADCAAGEVCTLGGTEEAPANLCRPAWGDVGAGALCETSNDCRSGICLDTNRCYGACSGDADCLEGSTCGSVSVGEGGSVELSICVEPTQPCDSLEDCRDGWLCMPYESEPNVISGGCFPSTNAEGALPGEVCAADGDCASGSCIADGNGGRCYGLCNPEGNVGCGAGTACYVDQVSFTFDQGTPDSFDDVYDSTTACLEDFGSFRECDGNSDCPGVEVCAPFDNKNRNGFQPRCIDAVRPNGDATGRQCFSDLECALFCAEFSGGLFRNNACFTLCEADRDCEAGYTTCETQTLLVNDRGTPNNRGDDITDELRICTP